MTKTALVLSGGGARGAYEAGVLHYIRSEIPESIDKINYYCGTSVGAVNVCFLAATANEQKHQGEKLRELWESIPPGIMFKKNIFVPIKFISSYLKFWFMNKFMGRTLPSPVFPGLIDVHELVSHLQKIIPVDNIKNNLDKFGYENLAIVATNLLTGLPETFLPVHSPETFPGSVHKRYSNITLKHVLASAAVPFLFPPVPLKKQLYIDGSLRMSTPLAPAVHLGAERILVIGTLSELANRKKANPVIRGNSGISLLIGRIVNSIFLDKLETDLSQTSRINRLLESGEKLFGDDFIQKINNQMHTHENRENHKRNIRKIQTLVVRPSKVISNILADYEKSRLMNKQSLFRKMLKGRATDLMSYTCFDREYLKQLTALGYADAKKQRDELVKFFRSE